LPYLFVSVRFKNISRIMPLPDESDSLAGPSKFVSKTPSKTRAGAERKKGFHVGPAHAPRNAYLGKGQPYLPTYQLKTNCSFMESTGLT